MYCIFQEIYELKSIEDPVPVDVSTLVSDMDFKTFKPDILPMKISKFTK